MRSMTTLLVVSLLLTIDIRTATTPCNIGERFRITKQFTPAGTSCVLFLEKDDNCDDISIIDPHYATVSSRTRDNKTMCTVDNLNPMHDKSLNEHHQKLSAHITKISSPAISPHVYQPEDPSKRFRFFDNRQMIKIEPMVARITEVSEKQQAISVMMILKIVWVDHRLTWDETEYGHIPAIDVTRDSIWRPPIYPLNIMSFSNDDASKPNVKIHSSGSVMDPTIWNFRMAVNMLFPNFPFDTQTFYIQIASASGFHLKGTRYIVTETESDSEWKIVDDFEEVPNDDKPYILTYKVTLKRYPYFWIRLIIIPCFILGFLVISALTLAADSSTIETLVNIGLAASVSSAVVVSTMTDHFPKTENLPSIATFVQSQFIIIVSVLITLSVRKSLMPYIDSALAKWQKTENNEELSTKTKILVVIVKILKHRLFLFVVFGIAYVSCFSVIIRHMNFNFDKKKREIEYDIANPLAKNKGQ